MKLFGKYEEVYATLNMEDFFRAKNLLSDHGIAFKDTSRDNHLRLTFNRIGDRSAALSRDGFVQNRYRLSVSKADARKARQILGELDRQRKG